MAESRRYMRLFESYYRDLSVGRVSDLKEQIAKFQEKVLDRQFNFSNSDFLLCVDEVRIYHIAKSYFYDVIRYKEFHFSPANGMADEDTIHFAPDKDGRQIDAPKQAAFMVKWLVRVKPLMIDNVSGAGLTTLQKELCVTLNEHFALSYASAVLELVFSAEQIETFVYQLHYRHIDESLLERLFNEASCSD